MTDKLRVLLCAPRDGHSELYLRRGFEQLGHEVTSWDYRNPNSQLWNMPLTGKDLIIILKGERFQAPDLKTMGHPLVLWDFDLWQQTAPGMEEYRKAMHERARAVDYFLTPSDGYFDKEFGIKSHYFLEAADPEFHYPAPTGNPLNEIDVTFIGTVEGVPGRDEWLEKVGLWSDANRKRFEIWGSFPGSLSKKWHTGRRATGPVSGEDLTHNMIVSSSKVNLDRQRNPEIRGVISARVFRTMAAGGFVLMRYVEGLGAIFNSSLGGEVQTYDTNEECIGAIEAFLPSEEARMHIAERGREKVLRFHTWKNRAAAIIKLVGL